MKRSISIVGVALLGGALFGFGGCGSSYNGGDAGTTYETSDLHGGSRAYHPRSHSEADAGTAATNAADSGAGSASTTPAATSTGAAPDVQAVVAAAQSPDGTAIPQGPGPNGECPEVLVLLGFWSCPQIGQTCNYAAAGATHHCLCDRLNGEGGLPAWVCDQSRAGRDPPTKRAAGVRDAGNGPAAARAMALHDRERTRCSSDLGSIG
jgi:hypothetical protein